MNNNVEGINLSIRDILKNLADMLREGFLGASEPEVEVKLPKELRAVADKWDKIGYGLLEGNSKGKEAGKSLRSNVQVSKAPKVQGTKSHTIEGITEQQKGQERVD